MLVEDRQISERADRGQAGERGSSCGQYGPRDSAFASKGLRKRKASYAKVLDEVIWTRGGNWNIVTLGELEEQTLNLGPKRLKGPSAAPVTLGGVLHRKERRKDRKGGNGIR